MQPQHHVKLPEKLRIDEELVLKKALIRLTDRFAITQQELSKILHVSESTISRLFNKQDKVFIDEERAVLLLRLYRSLDALFGGDEKQYQLWLRSENKNLHGNPLQLIQSMEGLVAVVQYLEYIRG